MGIADSWLTANVEPRRWFAGSSCGSAGDWKPDTAADAPVDLLVAGCWFECGIWWLRKRLRSYSGPVCDFFGRMVPLMSGAELPGTRGGVPPGVLPAVKDALDGRRAAFGRAKLKREDEALPPSLGVSVPGDMLPSAVILGGLGGMLDGTLCEI